jgi:hypothetical protein
MNPTIHFEKVHKGLVVLAADEAGTTELKRFLVRNRASFPYYWDHTAKWYFVRSETLTVQRKLLQMLNKEFDAVEAKIRGVTE